MTRHSSVYKWSWLCYIWTALLLIEFGSTYSLHDDLLLLTSMLDFDELVPMHSNAARFWVGYLVAER